MRDWIRVLRMPSILGGALRISAVVGTLLNVINQGGQIAAGEPVSWPHLAMNYLVPFCVACYSAARNEIRKTGI